MGSSTQLGGGRRGPRRGGLVTAATVVSLLAATGLTVLGLGAADQAVASFDAASWVWSRAKGELARINGVTARVDTRLDVRTGQGHAMQVTQTDRFVLLRNASTGQVGSLDLASLRMAASTPTTAGLGVSVALHEDAAFVIDAVQGVVRQLDPRTLTPLGDPLRYPPGISGGVFDGAGRLWIAVPSEGTISSITAAPLPSSPSTGGTGGAVPAAGPHLVRTVPVAAPSHDLAVSALDDGVAVLDRTTNVLTTISDEAQRTVTLPLSGPGTMPARTEGDVVPVTVADDRRVYAVTADGIREFAVPGSGDGLRPAVLWQGRFYCADERGNVVHVLDGTGRHVQEFPVRSGGGALELEVRENHLFINAPDASTARVVDQHHRVRVVDKYADDVLGGDPPPTPPPPPPPRKPVVGKPSAPRGVTAAAGNARARVSWRPAAANGAAIMRYVVEGAGRRFQVGANHRSLEVTGLVNGQTYRFSVHAVNAKGAGPSRTSNPVRPTAEVPDPPERVTAEARRDGSVAVRWPAANGQGRGIRRYTVTAVAPGGTAPVGDSDRTELVVKPGELRYGTQYAFTVVAVNDRGAGSKSSPASNSVVPFTVPDRPPTVDAATVGDRAGAIRVAWGAPADNGRPITRYVVRAGGRDTDVTDGTEVTLTGFGDGQTVPVQVRAVNEAGESEPGGATARTVALPELTVQSWDATVTSVKATVVVDAGGGTATCTLAVAGKGSDSGPCRQLQVGDLLPATDYTVTVTAKNAAGTSAPVKRSVSTEPVRGRSVCVNNTDSSDRDQHTWCDNERNGMEIFSGTSQSTRRLGRGRNGQSFEAICKATGERINDYVYNPGKMGTGENDGTATWIRLKYGDGTGYMSFAWFNLDGYGVNSTGPLPDC